MAANEDLLAFVKDALGRGMPRPAVTDALGRAGWPPAQVASALRSFADVDFPIPVPRPRKSLSARDAFVYLVLFSMLYTIAIHAGQIAFVFIETQFPDPAAAPRFYGAVNYVATQVRWALSALVVALPVFLFTSWRTSRDVAADPTKRQSAVRRWLSYLTLFSGASVLICDVVAVVYYALGGELTVRFVLKAGAIGLIAAVAFAYVWSMRGDEAPAPAGAFNRLSTWAMTGLGTLAVITGVILAGSPTEARVRRLDDARVQDLQRLSSAIDLSYNRTGALPASLVALDPTTGIQKRPTDPVTGADYGYSVTATDKYELCATFDRATEEMVGGPPFWTHAAGPVCFPVTVQRVRR